MSETSPSRLKNSHWHWELRLCQAVGSSFQSGEPTSQTERSTENMFPKRTIVKKKDAPWNQINQNVRTYVGPFACNSANGRTAVAAHFLTSQSVLPLVF